MQEDSRRSASYTVPCEGYVDVVEFSPFDNGTAGSLLAYGGNQLVVVGSVRFQVSEILVNFVERFSLVCLHLTFIQLCYLFYAGGRS